MKARKVETLCPEHFRRHSLVVGDIRGQKVAQCPSSQMEWDIVQLRAKGVIVDLESGREVREPLEVEA